MYKLYIYLGILCLLTPASWSGVVNGIRKFESHERDLMKHLLKFYNAYGSGGRPIANHSAQMEIAVGLVISQFLDVDENKQLLITNGYLNLIWEDNLLVWNSSDYGGINKTLMDINTIWRPDFSLLNFVDSRLSIYRDNRATVYDNGVVSWMPKTVFKSRCTIDMTAFPFDSQECFLDFGSLTYGVDRVKLKFLDYKGISFCEYFQSPEWILNSTDYSIEGELGVRNRTVNEEIEFFNYIRFIVRLRRNSIFFVFTLIVPALMMTCLTVVTFWLPPESPAKMIFGINNFLAFFFLMMVLDRMTPSDIKEVPLIAKYFCLNMIMLIVSSMLAAVVTHLYFRTHINGRPAKLIRLIVLEKLGRLVFVRQFVPALDENLETETDKTNDICIGGKIASLLCYSSNSTEGDNNNEASLIAQADLKSYEQDSPVLLSGSSELERDVKETKRIIQVLIDKLKEKKKKNYIAIEWRTTALILDRTFFIIHVLVVAFAVAINIPELMRKIDFEVKRNSVHLNCASASMLISETILPHTPLEQRWE